MTSRWPSSGGSYSHMFGCLTGSSPSVDIKQRTFYFRVPPQALKQPCPPQRTRLPSSTKRLISSSPWQQYEQLRLADRGLNALVTRSLIGCPGPLTDRGSAIEQRAVRYGSSLGPITKWFYSCLHAALSTRNPLNAVRRSGFPHPHSYSHLRMLCTEYISRNR